jgi:hypothetical protein
MDMPKTKKVTAGLSLLAPVVPFASLALPQTESVAPGHNLIHPINPVFTLLFIMLRPIKIIGPFVKLPTPTLGLAVSPLAFLTIVTPYGIAVLIIFLVLSPGLDYSLQDMGALTLVMVLNLLCMLYGRQILKAMGVTSLQILGDEGWCRFFRKNKFLVGLSMDGWAPAGRGSLAAVVRRHRRATV